MASRNTPNTDNIDRSRRLSRRELQSALRIFRFIQPYRASLILGLVFLVGSTLTVLTVPILAGKFLDVATGKFVWIFTSIERVAMVFAAILVLQAFFSFFRVYLFARVSERAMADIRAEVYGKLITFPISFFEQRRVGELNSRLTADVGQLQDTLSFTIAEFFRQIVTIVLGTGYLFWQSPSLTLFMVATFPVLVIAALIFGRFIRRIAKQAQDQLATANVIVEETLQAIQVVKAFTNEWLEFGRYRQALHHNIITALRLASYRGLFTVFVILLLFGGLIMVLAYGAILVERGELSVGELTTFIIFSAFIGGSLGGTAELYGQLQKTIGASERILEILNMKGEVPLRALEVASPPLLKGASIRFEGVHFAYPTRPDVEVLRGVSLEIKPGQQVALVGQSGAGKSTIAQLLSRFHAPSEGHIYYGDTPIHAFDLLEYRREIGIVPQEVLLFGGTIRENILYGKPTASETEVIEAAHQANAWEFIQGFPEGLDTVVGERGIKLSGGQRQRIAIARAILKNPAVLILDEATSSLDAESERLVQEALNRLMQNRTTLVIAHRLATIRQADCIYVLEEGRVAEGGTHEELSAHPNGIYASLVKLQFDWQEKGAYN